MENAIEIGNSNEALVRRCSKVHLYVHLVWRTRWSHAGITRDFERLVHRAIAAEAIRLGCKVIAVNGMPDHVHLLVRLPSTLCTSILVKQVKGTSSSMVNTMKHANDSLASRFRWQDSYACFSVGIGEVDCIAAYIRGQKRHHAEGHLWPDWEESDEAHVVETPLPGGYPAERP